MDKTSLRRKLRQLRNQLSSAERRELSQKILAQLADFEPFLGAKNIGFYLSADGEVETSDFLQRALQLGKNCFLPALQGNSLIFRQYFEDSILAENRYGISEVANGAIYQMQDLDLIFLPLVAADRHGDRLGRGKGYYDISLSYKLDQATVPPILVGLAYDFQVIAELAADPWDVRLDYLLTDREIIACL